MRKNKKNIQKCFLDFIKTGKVNNIKQTSYLIKIIKH